MVNIGVLTSSRADFGVYLPLLNELKRSSIFNLEIIAFGSHTSKYHGYTINEIEDNNFEVKYAIPTLLTSDSEEGISTSAALCSLKFSSFWAENSKKFDLVFCLGDRYEMFAAVSAGIPFGLKFAHLYGGDISLGAIDNIYRDCLTHFSVLHFTSTEKCRKRVENLKLGEDPVAVTGILSLDDVSKLELLSLDEFLEQWDIDLNKPTILITFHPETVESSKNKKFAVEIESTCRTLVQNFQLVITMPNADTEGYNFREKFQNLSILFPDSIHLIENFGRKSYFTCLKYSTLVLGNSSSGLSEAGSFNKFSINVGDRQKGREVGENVINVGFNKTEILNAVNSITTNDLNFAGENIYYREGGVQIIVEKLQNYFQKNKY